MTPRISLHRLLVDEMGGERAEEKSLAKRTFVQPRPLPRNPLRMLLQQLDIRPQTRPAPIGVLELLPHERFDLEEKGPDGRDVVGVEGVDLGGEEGDTDFACGEEEGRVGQERGGEGRSGERRQKVAEEGSNRREGEQKRRKEGRKQRTGTRVNTKRRLQQMVHLSTNLRIDPRVRVLNDQLVDGFGVLVSQTLLDDVGGGRGTGGR